MNYQANANERADAARDRREYWRQIQNPTKGWQMAHAFVDAALQTVDHPLSEQIGRVIRKMEA